MCLVCDGQRRWVRCLPDGNHGVVAHLLDKRRWRTTKRCGRLSTKEIGQRHANLSGAHGTDSVLDLDGRCVLRDTAAERDGEGRCNVARSAMAKRAGSLAARRAYIATLDPHIGEGALQCHCALLEGARSLSGATKLDPDLLTRHGRGRVSLCRRFVPVGRASEGSSVEKPPWKGEGTRMGGP
eukprot:scaffold163165_cov34-Tisochrysis_lutea.AAC.2